MMKSLQPTPNASGRLNGQVSVRPSRGSSLSFSSNVRGAGLLRSHLYARRNACPRRTRMSVQANLFDRVVRVAKSYANALVSSVEDPEKVLDQAVEDMQNVLIRLRQGAAEVTASEKRMKAKCEQAQKNADEWYRRAELALEKNDEELAREALTRRKAFQENADLLRSQLEAQGKAVTTIVTNMRTLETKLAEAKMKKDTLKARAQSAKSARAINDMVGGMSTGSALSAFEKMEEKVEGLEAQADAATLLVGGVDDVESKFRMLEGGDVDDDLAQMKARLAPPAIKGQLPGRLITDAIDVELEELRKKSMDD